MTEMRRVPVDDGGKSKWKRPEDIPEAEVAATEDEVDDSGPISEECTCPELDPEEWHETESDWSEAPFIHTTVAAMMGVPLRFKHVRGKLEELAEAAGATVPDDAMLIFGPGKVRRQVMIEVEVDGDPASRKGVHVPGGIAYSRLVAAPWGEMKRIARDTEAAAAERYGKKPDALWVWYLTCNICSAERNYETLFIAHYKKAPAA